jgi:hypothetical protein
MRPAIRPDTEKILQNRFHCPENVVGCGAVSFDGSGGANFGGSLCASGFTPLFPFTLSSMYFLRNFVCSNQDNAPTRNPASNV